MDDFIEYTDFSLAAEYPLHRAAQAGEASLLSYLISEGENVNSVTFDNTTPLHDACLAGSIHCVQILLDAGACVNARNVDAATPLCDACNNGNIDVVNLLLSYGAEVNPNLNLTTPLHEAVLSDKTTIVQLLADVGANLEANDLHFGSPLHVAAQKNRMISATILLQAGAQVDNVRYNQAAIHIAAKNNCMEMVTLLLDHGAQVYYRNNWGQRPSDLAPKNSECKILLKKYEENPYSLRHLSRLAVWKSLYPKSKRTARYLNIAPALKTFLQYGSK